MGSETNLTEEQITKTHLQLAKILYFLQRLPQFTVALVQGSTMGAAVGLVCACDMVISVKGAFYAMSETKLGAVATTSIPYITPGSSSSGMCTSWCWRGQVFRQTPPKTTALSTRWSKTRRDSKPSARPFATR